MKWTDPETGVEYRVGNVMDERFMTRFIQAVRNGCTDGMAARIVGIDPIAVYGWRERAANPDEKYNGYRHWVRKIDEARGLFGEEALGVIHDAAVNRRSWSAAAWLLERRFPDEFSPLQRSRMEVSNSSPTEDSDQVDTQHIDLSLLSPEELIMLHNMMGRSKQVIDVDATVVDTKRLESPS